jgi:hypothetical protein
MCGPAPSGAVGLGANGPCLKMLTERLCALLSVILGRASVLVTPERSNSCWAIKFATLPPL